MPYLERFLRLHLDDGEYRVWEETVELWSDPQEGWEVPERSIQSLLASSGKGLQIRYDDGAREEAPPRLVVDSPDGREIYFAEPARAYQTVLASGVPFASWAMGSGPPCYGLR